MVGRFVFSSIFSPYFRPKDPAWQGPQRAVLPLILVKNIVFLAYVGLSTAEVVSFWKWTGEPIEDQENSGTSYMTRAGAWVLVEAIHSIIVSFLICFNKFHIITALVLSVLYFICWSMATWVIWLIVYSNEIPFDEIDQWRAMGYGECGVAGVLALLYGVMMILAAIGVHKYRRAKREEKHIPLKDVQSGEANAV